MMNSCVYSIRMLSIVETSRKKVHMFIIQNFMFLLESEISWIVLFSLTIVNLIYFMNLECYSMLPKKKTFLIFVTEKNG